MAHDKKKMPEPKKMVADKHTAHKRDKMADSEKEGHKNKKK